MSFNDQSGLGRVGGSTFRSRGVKALTFAAMMVLASAAVAGDRVGRFCPECRDQGAAQQVAVSTAKASFADGESIGRVFVINHLTEQLFAFNVSPGNSRPRAVLSRMSPDERAVAEAIIELRFAWEEFAQDLGALLVEADLTGNALTRSPVSFTAVDAPCPVGTALDFHLAPHLMADIINQINELATAAAETRLDFMPGASFRVDRLGGVGVMMPTGGFVAQWEPGSARGPTLFRENFDVSEHPGPLIPDRLIFENNLMATLDSPFLPLFKVDLIPEASRSAGMPLAAWHSGAEANRCVARKLEAALNELGATYHMPPGNPRPMAFPANIAEPGSGPDSCRRLMAAKLGGVTSHKFTINIPCEET